MRYVGWLLVLGACGPAMPGDPCADEPLGRCGVSDDTCYQPLDIYPDPGGTLLDDERRDQMSRAVDTWPCLVGGEYFTVEIRADIPGSVTARVWEQASNQLAGGEFLHADEGPGPCSSSWFGAPQLLRCVDNEKSVP